MKIPHGHLEAARANPETYAQRAASQSATYRMSAFRLWQFAIREYHRRNQDLSSAHRYLESKFRKTFRGGPRFEQRLLEFKAHLDIYAHDFAGLAHNVVGMGDRISMDIGHGVSMTGEIGRVDLITAAGYGAYLFLREKAQWRDELRMPLLQAYFAHRFSVQSNLVQVGVYTLELGKHEDTQYSDRRIADALHEAAGVARSIVAAQRRS